MAFPGIITSHRPLRWLVGAIALGAAAMGWFSLRGSSPAAPAPVAIASSATPAPVKPTPTTVRFTDSKHHPWPPKAEVAGPPAGSGIPVNVVPHDIAIKPGPHSAPKPEPAAPSVAEMKEESLRTGDQVAAESAREVLLDDRRGSALKLVIIDKLRGQNPDEVIPVLVAFLEHPGTPAAAYTKPTALKVLADLRDPRADEALQKLARSSPDERVRLTIAALQAKEKSR